MHETYICSVERGISSKTKPEKLKYGKEVHLERSIKKKKLVQLTWVSSALTSPILGFSNIPSTSVVMFAPFSDWFLMLVLASLLTFSRASTFPLSIGTICNMKHRPFNQLKQDLSELIQEIWKKPFYHLLLHLTGNLHYIIQWAIFQRQSWFLNRLTMERKGN